MKYTIIYRAFSLTVVLIRWITIICGTPGAMRASLNFGNNTTSHTTLPCSLSLLT